MAERSLEQQPGNIRPDSLNTSTRFPKDRYRIPKHRDEFIDYLLKESPSLWLDGARAMTDLARGAVELWELRRFPIYEEESIPRGDGSVVIVGPGFGAAGFMYRESYENLSKIGYEAKMLPLYFGFNIEPTESMVHDCIEFLKREREQNGEKVHVVLHSKSGHLGWAAYALYPREFNDSVDQFITVGSPVPTRVNLVVGTGYLASQYVFGADDFKLAELAEKNNFFRLIDGVRVTTLRIKNDPIVDGIYLGPEEDQFEMESSHSGALIKRDNLCFIVERLGRFKR